MVTTLERLVPEGDPRGFDSQPRSTSKFIREIVSVPLAFFEERTPIVDVGERALGYLQLSARYERDADGAGNRGWVVHHLKSDHLAMITQPIEVAEAINLMIRQCAAAISQ
jgi:hypothetical protein